MLRQAGRIAVVFVATLVAGVAAQPVQAGSYKVLHVFKGGNDGASPESSLILDAAGNPYGVTAAGGASGCNGGCGTVFKLDITGKETILYTFTGGADGAYPSSPLSVDANGTFYGTTYGGGNLNYCGGHGCGTVFKLDSTGKETVLYAFTDGIDGEAPNGPLITDVNGNFYGTTSAGSGAGCGGQGCGTVFELDTTDKLTTLYTFTGRKDGGNPAAGVVRDANGNLYGTTFFGGDPHCIHGRGCGVVFKVDSTGKETVLHAFLARREEYPYAGVILDTAGNVYGTTYGNPDFTSDHGDVYEVDTTGKETVLLLFGDGDGTSPVAGVIRDAAGNLYGTCSHTRISGRTETGGTVYKLDPSGHETVLHFFKQARNGKWPGGDTPYAGVVQDSNGNLYGATLKGGDPTCDCGVVFKLTP